MVSSIKGEIALLQIRDAVQRVVRGLWQPRGYGRALQRGEEESRQLLFDAHLRVPHEVPFVRELLRHKDRPAGRDRFALHCHILISSCGEW